MRYLIWFFLMFSPTTALACAWADLEWQRTDAPVFRDVIPDINYEVASDAHVFWSGDSWHIIYSGDDQDQIAIKLTSGAGLDTWNMGETVLGVSTGHTQPRYKETPFYRLADSGKHQIYFIGYDDEETYQAQVYLAEADSLSGPYQIDPDPVIPRGAMGGEDVYLITSPSVVPHDGLLYMVFLGWNGFENVTNVWAFGAVSSDDGHRWQDIRKVDVPIGMEGQLTPHQDGFIATRTGAFGATEGIAIACADHPFGPYTDSDPVLQLAGPPWEVDEIIAPQVTFDHANGTSHLFYTGADHAKGWWIMHAQTTQTGATQ